ncbi:MAG: DUF6446 family protein [Pseudomonadota bacterium]
MSGKLIAILLVACGIVAGAAMYWLQVYAFYERLAPSDIDLTVTADGTSGPLDVVAVEAIDASSSPIRFRACFEVDGAVTGDAYEGAVPLNAPGWFGCFDAAAIGEDLVQGRATAVLGKAHVQYGIDRVLAFYSDGRGFAWHQINPCGEAAFDGDPLPAGCPQPPEEFR